MSGGKEPLKGSIYATQTSTSPSFFELVFPTRKRREIRSGGARHSNIYISVNFCDQLFRSVQ